MPELIPCASCAEHVVAGTCICPHCGHRKPCRSKGLTAGVALLGLGLVGCPGAVQADYGVAETGWGDSAADQDGDGFTEDDGDCDDGDASVNPDAEETPGDGIDSNCNGDDDT